MPISPLQSHTATGAAAVAELDNTTRLKLESIFGMSGGYVLDFSNARFADFVETSIGFDPYDRYGKASKAVLLRTIWHKEPDSVVARLNLELLEHWRVSKLIGGTEPTPTEATLHDELKAKFEPQAAAMSTSDTAFLAKDFGEVRVEALPRSLTSKEVIEARLREIDVCLEAGASLAVIFLVGSTLEGVLLDLALAQPKVFLAATAAPKPKGVGKPLDRWTLAELLAVASEIGILGADVSRHADQVRNFRNYIHPRQQLREGFEPRIETARIAQQVLRAALADLSRQASRDLD